MTEWATNDPSAATFQGKRREVLRLGVAGQVHGIQQVDFNPAAGRRDRNYGMLYVAVGDGGQGATGDDPQDLTVPHGKILRVDPQGTDSAGHIGEHAIEAIYDVRAGDNLGWSEREGTLVFKRDDRCRLYALPQNDATYRYSYPVAAYDHDPPSGWPCNQDRGHAVSGGFVYRGSQVQELKGKYVFGDIVDGRIFLHV